MAKLKIMGDVLQIKSELTAKEIERVEAFAPKALKLFDNEGNEVFGIAYPVNASWSKYGVCFCSKDDEGKVFMTTNNPVLEHDDPEKERTEVIKKFAPVLNKLEAIEAQVAAAKDALEEMEASVTDSVTFA